MSRYGSPEYRKWRADVIDRDVCCVVCGATENLHAHHKNDYSYHPDMRYDIENGVTMCEKHHTMFHCDYKNSFREKTTQKDFEEFMRIVRSLETTFTKQTKDKICCLLQKI